MALKTSLRPYYNVAGMLGAALLIGAYVLYSMGSIQATGLEFQVMNILGALGLTISSIYKKNWAAVAVFLAWGALSAYTVYVYLSV